MMNNQDKRILVIIVTYNAMKWIDRCLTSLAKSSISVDTYIIDNGSTDNTVQYIRTSYPNANISEAESNLGFGKANNLGFEYALLHNYDYVYLLNQDAWVFESTFAELVAVQQEHSDYGILSPMQLHDGCKKTDDNFLLCCPKEMLSDLYCNVVKTVYETRFVMAAHWLISKECLMKVGGFSPSFPHYGEDHNFIHRSQYFKYKVGLVPAAKAIHDRELRAETSTLKLRKLYLESVANISNLNSDLLATLVSQPIFLLNLAVKYKSLTGMVNVVKLIVNVPNYIKNRSRSRSFAFLNLNK